MAHIPVQKKEKSGLGWLLPVVLLALLAIGAVWLITSMTGDDVDATAETAVVADSGEAKVDVDVVDAPSAVVLPATATVTSKDIADTSLEELAGRDVSIKGMKVTRVVGDKSFYVVPADGSTKRRSTSTSMSSPLLTAPSKGATTSTRATRSLSWARSSASRAVTFEKKTTC